MPTCPTSRPRPGVGPVVGSLAFVLFGSLGLAASTTAQQPAPAADSASAQGTPSERSPLVAGLLQAALPPLPIGYLYAGSFARGLIPTGIMLVGTSILLVEAVEIFDWTEEGERGELLWLGFGLSVGGYVFGIVDAANVARGRNARLRVAGAALRLVPASSGVGIAVTIPVG